MVFSRSRQFRWVIKFLRTRASFFCWKRTRIPSSKFRSFEFLRPRFGGKRTTSARRFPYKRSRIFYTGWKIEARIANGTCAWKIRGPPVSARRVSRRIGINNFTSGKQHESAWLSRLSRRLSPLAEWNIKTAALSRYHKCPEREASCQMSRTIVYMRWEDCRTLSAGKSTTLLCTSFICLIYLNNILKNRNLRRIQEQQEDVLKARVTDSCR